MSQEEKNYSQQAVQEAEPWAEWEGRLVKWSLAIGVAALVVLGALINIFLLM
ncbi:MAG: hypothetical protein V5A14_01075 [Desulfohalobiaceae bacterium]